MTNLDLHIHTQINKMFKIAEYYIYIYHGKSGLISEIQGCFNIRSSI